MAPLRLDKGGATGLTPLVVRSSRTMLKQLGVKVSGYPGGLVPLDVDVFPQDNSNTRKEGVSRTCKNFDGYAPIAASLGMEGWCLESELRPGSQHGQAGFVVFIQRVFKAAQVFIEQEILVYLAGRLISTGRPLVLRFSWHCPVSAAFQGVYEQLAPAG